MVGKGTEPKSSRIFHQCYLKCCKLQNLTPLNNVIPSGNGKVLDFCVDRIKYTEWPPILNALSCDLSLHSVAIKCRNQVKTVAPSIVISFLQAYTSKRASGEFAIIKLKIHQVGFTWIPDIDEKIIVLEHIDCERLAKTVNKRAVILTNFMLNNLVEATAQLLSNTTLLTTLTLEGLPMKIPYLNPLCEALLTNNSLQHVYLPRCLIGDAGCLAICKSIRCLPNILTLDLSGCELTSIGAGYITDLVKYQKIHRYSENWCHTLRYRLPQLDSMAGLRRITVCANPQLADAGVAKLLDVLSDDLWIKALDIQNCGLSEVTATSVLRMLASNTTMVVLDMRHNADISSESLSKVRAALRDNERGVGGQFSWISSVSGASSEARLLKYNGVKNGVIKDRTTTNVRNIPTKYVGKSTVVKKEKDYSEILEEQLQEEISHRQQLEELNLQLVDQMKQLKQQQIPLWANGTASSGSEHSLEASSRSCDLSSSSGSSSSVPIDQNTLSYIQQAFKDIYIFIKNNQCYGQCIDIKEKLVVLKAVEEAATETEEPELERDSAESAEEGARRPAAAKRAHSTHAPLGDSVKVNKTTKSAHLLGDTQQQHRLRVEMKPEMIERQIGDTRNVHNESLNILEEMISVQTKPKKSSVPDKGSSSPGSSGASDSDTLVSSPSPRDGRAARPAINPRDAFSSSEDDEDDDDD